MDFDKEVVGPLNTTRIHFDFLVPPVVNRYHHAHELWQLPYGNSIWNSLMDNVYFSSLTLRNYLNNNLSKFLFTWQQFIKENLITIVFLSTTITELCTVYPQLTLTFDNTTELHHVSQYWEHVATSWYRSQNNFVILTRSVSINRIAVVFAVGQHYIEIEPTEDGLVVEVDNNKIEKPENGFIVPDDHTPYIIK